MNEKGHLSGQSKMLTCEIFERLSIGHINNMEGIITQNNDKHKVREGRS